MSDDQNPTRPTPHGTPDRRYVDRSPPRQSERIPPAELVKLVEGFVPEYCRRVGIKQRKPKGLECQHRQEDFPVKHPRWGNPVEGWIPSIDPDQPDADTEGHTFIGTPRVEAESVEELLRLGQDLDQTSQPDTEGDDFDRGEQ